MGEPQKFYKPDDPYDDSHSEEPITNPDFLSQAEGAGSTGMAKKGSDPKKLRHRVADYAKADVLASAEEAGDQDTESSDGKEFSSEEEKAIQSWYKDKPRGEKDDGKKKKKTLLLALGGGTGLMAVGLVVVMMFFLSSLKGVHFATIMRSTGFASTQLVMRKTFSDIAFDASMLSEDSVGSLTRYERSMWERVRRVNPDKVMKSLGQGDDQFKIVTERKGIFGTKEIGFEVRGKRFLKDDFAQKFGKETYKDLTWREKLTVKNDILSTVSDEMAETLRAESRTFRSSFFKGFQHHFNIRTSAWAQKGRELIGKSYPEADIDNRTKTYEEITKDESLRSNLDMVNQASDEFDDAVKKGILDRANMRTKDWADSAFKKVGVDDVAAFSDAAGKVSIGVFAITMYCTAREIDNSLTDINKQKEAQAQRYMHDIQTKSDQVRRGEVSSVATGAFSAEWDNGGEHIPSADASPLYREATGYNYTGKNVDADIEGAPTAKIPASPLHTIIELVDGVIKGPAQYIPGVENIQDAVINEACGLALNPIAQATVAGIDVVVSVLAAAATGGLTEAIKTAAKSAVVLGLGIYGGNLIGEWLQNVITNFAGGNFTGAEKGTERYTAGAIATNYGNATTGRASTYGRPMDKEEAKGTQRVALAAERNYYSKGSLQTRYLAIDNPYSLVGRMAALTPATVPGLLSKINSGASSFVTNISSILSGARGFTFALDTIGLSQKASAAAPSDILADHNYFNIEQWGWSVSELARIDNDENFDTIKNGAWVEERNQRGELDAKYEKCYKPEAQTSVPEEGCRKADLSTDEALHWRLYKVRNSVIDQLADTDITEDDDSDMPNETGNNDLYYLGDSLTVGAKASGLDEKLTAKGWEPTSNGLVSRTISKEPPVPSGINKLEQDKLKVSQAGTIVIALGTNPGLSLRDELQQIYDKIRTINSTASVVWVNFVGTGSYAETMKERTKVLTDFAGPKNIKVIDWASVGSKYIPNNDVHPSNYVPMVDFIVNALGQAPQPAESGTGTDNTANCPVGTDEGIKDGYLKGVLTKVRICNVQGISVNTRIATSLNNMLNEARKAGINLTSSESFRTMAQQEYFWNCYQTKSCNNGNEAARPGFSNHQMGLAIDFRCNGGSMRYGGPCNVWLDANAARYNFAAKVSGEPWHWSLTGN
jgi:LAS superfamily LD-carboxypeptidase LdcB